MKIRFLASLVTLCACAAVAQNAQDLPDAPAPTSQAMPAPTATGPTVLLDTTMGRLTCRLFDKEAPFAAANFVGLATGTKDWIDPVTQQRRHGVPYYDGTTFHRVIPEFMIQGGDRTATGTGDAGYAFKNEIYPGLNFTVPGRLAMANAGPDTNGTQFFITETAQPQLDGGYTIFGQCDPASVALVTRITHLPRNPDDKPLTTVIVNKVTVLQPDQPVPPDPMPPAAPAAAAPAPAAR